MLGYLFRAVLYGIIAIALKGAPVVQITLYLLISILFIILIFTKKPAKVRFGNLELFIYEIIIFVTLCLATVLVINDAQGNSNIDKETLGMHVIIGFIALYIFEIIFIIINLAYAIKTRCGTRGNEKGKATTTHIVKLGTEGSQTGKEVEVEEPAPKFIWPAINTQKAKKVDDTQAVSERNQVILFNDSERPIINLKPKESLVETNYTHTESEQLQI